MKLLGLLPARNCAGDFHDYFSSISVLVDGVIALDDGSTDNTVDLIRANPLVKKTLTNPRRESYEGWDDSANRNRLLEAAGEFSPDWVVSVDADERIDPEEARLLRRFVEEEAVPGFAYGFRVFRMIGDLDHFEKDGLWVYRLFSYRPGLRFPS